MSRIIVCTFLQESKDEIFSLSRLGAYIYYFERRHWQHFRTTNEDTEKDQIFFAVQKPTNLAYLQIRPTNDANNRIRSFA